MTSVTAVPDPVDPTPEQIERILANAPDIGPEVIRQAGEHVEYLTGMAKSWIINGDEHHGAMLQCLCIAFGYQQTEIERLKVENANIRADVRQAREALTTANEQLAAARERMSERSAKASEEIRRRALAEIALTTAQQDALNEAADDIDSWLSGCARQPMTPTPRFGEILLRLRARASSGRKPTMTDTPDLKSFIDAMRPGPIGQQGLDVIMHMMSLAKDEIESLRSRLQAVEAERDEIDARARRAQELHMSSAWALVDWHVRADKAEASLTRVAQLQTIMASSPLEAVRRYATDLRAALPGGTSPEPTEPADGFEPGRWWTVLAPNGSLWCETSVEREARDAMRPGDRLMRQYVMTRSELRPVDVASEPE